MLFSNQPRSFQTEAPLALTNEDIGWLTEHGFWGAEWEPAFIRDKRILEVLLHKLQRIKTKWILHEDLIGDLDPIVSLYSLEQLNERIRNVQRAMGFN